MYSYDNQIIGTPNTVTYIFLCTKAYPNGFFSSSFSFTVDKTTPEETDARTCDVLRQVVANPRLCTNTDSTFNEDLTELRVNFGDANVTGRSAFNFNANSQPEPFHLIEDTNAVWHSEWFANYLINIGMFDHNAHENR